ncbi:MAG: phosphoribosylanthranilate isomerase [Planctomycetia bacterium]|nr:phosphoribosylanthranilate isomerase [Planctomycetia bacterium]
MNTKTKICGLTTPACVEACLAVGVDAIGLNFYPPSPRSVTLEQGARLRLMIPSTIQVVGVFVRPDQAWLQSVMAAIPLDVVQLHGTDAMYWKTFSPIAIPLWLACGIKSTDDLAEVQQQLSDCQAAGGKVTALLLDAKVDGQHGGTGQTAPWSLVKQVRCPVPLVLAGGLTPDNVAEAVQEVQPAWVDTASGVENQPGIKDADKVRRFVQAVRDNI